MVWVIRNKIPFQKPYLAPVSTYRSFSPFRFIQWVGGNWGENIPFPRKMSFSIKFSYWTELFTVRARLFFLYLLFYIMKANYKIKHLGGKYTGGGYQHLFSKRSFLLFRIYKNVHSIKHWRFWKLAFVFSSQCMYQNNHQPDVYLNKFSWKGPKSD